MKAVLPGNWQNFLRADSNKTELFSFLSKVLLQVFCEEDKDVVLTDGKGCSGVYVLSYNLNNIVNGFSTFTEHCYMVYAYTGYGYGLIKLLL